MDTKKSIGAVIVALVVIAYVGKSAFFGAAERPEEVVPYQATLSGTYRCLPHKEANGPQTLECAAGIEVDGGLYYALDFNQAQSSLPELSAGQYFSASGTVTPVEMLSTDMWQRYPIEGIFSVTGPLTIGKGGVEGASWEWIRTELPNGKVVEPPVKGKFILVLDGKGGMTSSTDCNRVGGSYELGDGALSFGAIYSTKMYCQGSLDGEYARELGLSATYRASNGELSIGLRDGGAMTFKIR